MLRFISLSILMLFNSLVFAQDAIYSLDFISNWNSTTHPTNYPAAAHWSTLIGATHNSSISFWQLGQLASEGVEEVAENGVVTIVKQDIITEMSNGNAYAVIELPLGFGESFSHDAAIDVDYDFPYISLMTMIAPSPDWLAEVNNLKLTDATGNWKTSITVNVYATDSGTDSGTTYVSPNEDTDPPVNIYSLQNTPPFSDLTIASFVFTLDQVLGVNDNLLQNAISISPNPSKGTIFIRNSSDSTLETAEIYSITGKKVKAFTDIANKKSLVFNSLQSGLYFIKINSDKGSITKKLIIQ